MRAGDSVQVIDRSWSVIVSKGALDKGVGSIEWNKNWTVLATGYSLPDPRGNDCGSQNTIISDGEQVVFIRSTGLRKIDCKKSDVVWGNAQK